MPYNRPKTTSSASSGASSLATNNWPLSQTDVILAGDEFSIDLPTTTIGYDQVYTVSAGTYNSDSSGAVTLNFTPVLVANVAVGVGIQLKNPRIISTNVKNAISNEGTENICYLMQFNFYNDTLGREEITNLTTAPLDLNFNYFDYEGTSKVITDGIQSIASTTVATENWRVNSKTLQRGQSFTFTQHTQTYTITVPTSPVNYNNIQVNGAHSASGNVIDLKGFGVSQTNAVRAGDVLKITDSSSVGYTYYTVKYSADADSSGNINNLELLSNLIYSISNNAAVDFTNYNYFSDSNGKVTFKITSGLEFQVADDTQLTKKWTGIGGNLGFEAITESNDLAAQGTDIILSGVDQSIISIVLSKKYIGRYCRTWLCHFNSSAIIIDSPLMIFWGRMNGGFDIEETREEDVPGTVEIRLRAVDRMGDLTRVRGIQTNLESHQKLYKGDMFFEFVDKTINKVIKWGPS